MIRNTEKREYHSSSRKEAAQLTRQTIIEVARHVFLEKGYAAATMPAIAQAAGVALGVLASLSEWDNLSEIQHVHRAVLADFHVGGFKVAMDDAARSNSRAYHAYNEISRGP
jgi:hypothetical protein